MVIDELVAKFSIKVDSNSVKKFNTTVGGLSRSLSRLPIRSLAAGSAIGLFASVLTRAALGVASYGTGLSNLSQSLDVPATKLQALQLAAKESGQSFSNVAQALGVLQSQFAGLLSGKGLSPQLSAALGSLSKVSGIDLRPITDTGKLKTTAQFLEQISNALRKVPSQRQRVAFSQRIFGTNVLPTLSRLPSAERTVGQAYFSTPKIIAQGKELQESLAKLEFAFKQLSLVIGSSILPVINGLTKAMQFVAHPTKKTFGVVTKEAASFFVPAEHSLLGSLANKLQGFREDAIKKTTAYHHESSNATTQNSTVTNAPVTNNVTNTQNIHYNNSNAFLSSLLIPEIR
jgi:hypothetical protein